MTVYAPAGLGTGRHLHSGDLIKAGRHMSALCFRVKGESQFGEGAERTGPLFPVFPVQRCVFLRLCLSHISESR